jgi:hypothetical protein
MSSVAADIPLSPIAPNPVRASGSVVREAEGWLSGNSIRWSWV